MQTGTTEVGRHDGPDPIDGPAAPGAPAPPPRRRGVTGWGPGRTVAFIVVTCLAGALLLGGVGYGALLAVGGPGAWSGRDGVNADGTIDGVRTYDGLSNLHVDTRVDYEQTPPVGGDHLAVWQDCGFYDAPVVSEAAVHSLEHGAVWVTYDPDLPRRQVQRLQDLAASNPYLLVSPMRDLPSAVVASAWGLQLQLDEVGDPRLPAFLAAYQQGPQNPEPGAPCSGGLSGTASQLSQV